MILCDNNHVKSIIEILFQGEHDATYNVTKSDTGVRFKKIRHKHPVSNARASYEKVTLSIVMQS